MEVERIDPGPSAGRKLPQRAVQALAPVLLALLIDAGDLATFPGTTLVALPLGMVAGYLFAGFLRVATPWRVIIACVTGLYWALPFTGLFPLATSITTVVEFLGLDRGKDESRS